MKIGDKVKILPAYDERAYLEMGKQSSPKLAGEEGIIVVINETDEYPIKVKMNKHGFIYVFKLDELEVIS